jgi:hypothetical protein
VLVIATMEPHSPLPEDHIIAEVLGKRPVEPGPRSLLAAYQKEVQAWEERGVRGTTITFECGQVFHILAKSGLTISVDMNHLLAEQFTTWVGYTVGN